MLKLLNIKNAAVIETAEIEFTAGFNVLTGETGAGKSVIVGSINALLGDRVSKDIIRAGEKSAVITGLFCDISDCTADVLESFGIDAENDGTLILSREIRLDGKNICRINGTPTTLSILKSVSQSLIAVHGQSDTHLLYDESVHLDMLDSFAQLNDLVESYRTMFIKLSKIRNQINSLKIDESEKLRMTESLEYQKNEIEDANLIDGEEEELLEKRRMLQSSEKILSALKSSYSILYGSDNEQGVCGSISSACKELLSISDLDKRFGEIHSKLSDLSFSADDIADDIGSILDGLDLDLESIDEIERRLDLIYRLKRKYGASIQEILKYCESIAEKLSGIQNSDEERKQLQEQYEKQFRITSDAALKLHDARNSAASKLSELVTRELADLDMKNARFIVRVEKMEKNNSPLLMQNGCDEVFFLAITNAGEVAKPISKAASGGELSRIMLALKNVMSESDSMQTMIFDEIDTGVSGHAALKIGEKLYSVSCLKQVLCVTHLSQISAFADSHFFIEKNEKDGKTFTKIQKLSDKQRNTELSRIMSGNNMSESTLKAAEEMLLACEKTKKMIKDKRRICNNDTF